MKIEFRVIFICFLTLFFGVLSANANEYEIAAKDAIAIAKAEATKKGYESSAKDIEVIAVRKGIEKGPIRLSWLIRYFPANERDFILRNEFWIVYFYPKGQLEDPHILGGEFCALVDLHSSEVLAAFKVP